MSQIVKNRLNSLSPQIHYLFRDQLKKPRKLPEANQKNRQKNRQKPEEPTNAKNQLNQEAKNQLKLKTEKLPLLEDKRSS